MPEMMLPATLRLEDYRIAALDRVLTPALAIFPDIIDANIDATLRLLGNDPQRWRPHIKTVKLAAGIARLVAHGVVNIKCATTLELLTSCKAGAKDVLVAFPCVGATAQRVQQIADQLPKVGISVLIENDEDVQRWRGSRVGLFIDVNPGMDRTGIEQERLPQIVALARSIVQAGIAFRGLHYYDGHRRETDLAERRRLAYAGYDQLLRIVAALQQEGIPVAEIITSGTPALPCAISYPGLQGGSFVHRISPGTVVYGDTTSLAQLPSEWGYRPAALVVATVISHPGPDLITCDAGHKTVSADSGIPNCAVLGHPEMMPQQPSEEHLPIRVAAGHPKPRRGEHLYLVPRHVCPTVNNFEQALIVRDGHIAGVERVTARGRETPLVLQNAPELAVSSD